MRISAFDVLVFVILGLVFSFPVAAGLFVALAVFITIFGE